MFCLAVYLFEPFVVDECATVRKLKAKEWWSDLEESVQHDLKNVTIDAATVTETIIALAEMKSKQHHTWISLGVLLFAVCAGFSQQIIQTVGTVR